MLNADVFGCYLQVLLIIDAIDGDGLVCGENIITERVVCPLNDFRLKPGRCYDRLLQVH